GSGFLGRSLLRDGWCGAFLALRRSGLVDACAKRKDGLAGAGSGSGSGVQCVWNGGGSVAAVDEHDLVDDQVHSCDTNLGVKLDGPNNANCLPVLGHRRVRLERLVGVVMAGDACSAIVLLGPIVLWLHM